MLLIYIVTIFSCHNHVAQRDLVIAIVPSALALVGLLHLVGYIEPQSLELSPIQLAVNIDKLNNILTTWPTAARSIN